MVSVSRYLVVALCSTVLLLSGCATTLTELDPPTSPDAILVIGNFDMSEAMSTLTQVDIERLKPDPDKFNNKFWVIHKGESYTFFSAVLTTGQYKFSGAGGRMGRNRMWYDLEGDARFTRTFPKPGIYYVGTYKIRTIMPKGMVGRAKNEITSIKEPGERELLLKVLPYAKHEYWKKLIERRLKELTK